MHKGPTLVQTQEIYHGDIKNYFTFAQRYNYG